MSSFSGYDESKHARSADGKFAAKSTGEADIDLGTGSNVTEVDVDQINGSGFYVDAARVITNEDGTRTLELDKFVDDFEALDNRTYPGYCADRTELIEAYAETQWGAELDNTIGWSEDEIGNQRLTFSMPQKSTRGIDLEDHVANDIQEAILDNRHGTFGAFNHDSAFDDEVTLSNMQAQLDEADRRSGEVSDTFARLNARSGGNVPMSSAEWRAGVAEFRADMADRMRREGLDALADSDASQRFGRKMFSRQAGTQVPQASLGAHITGEAGSRFGDDARVDVEAVAEQAYDFDDKTSSYYQCVDDDELDAIYERNAQN